MTALTLNQEFGLMRVRFRRTLAISAGLHVLFFGWVVVNRQWAPVNEPVVEITWLDQALQPVAVEVQPEPTEIKPVITKPEPRPELSVKEKLAQNSVQTESARDKMKSLQPSAEVARALSVAPSSAADLWNTSLATMAPVVRRETPVNLNRGGGAHEPAVALTRGAASSSNGGAPVAALPGTPSLTPKTELQPASGAVVNLGGATLSGLVADRQVLSHTMPIYPAWATTEAVEATVTLYFLVLASGQVKENVQVQKTGGAADFDRNAVAAIRQWRFEALSGQTTREQWGAITFRYRLNN